MAGAVPALAEHLAGLALVDQHMHGFWTRPVTREQFANGLNEANTDPLADPDSAFDSQVGFALRAHCAPVLGLARHAGIDDYWARRSALDAHRLAATFLTATGTSDWLVDTGVPGVAGPAEVAGCAAGRAHEVVRLEEVAEQAAAADGGYAEAFDAILSERAAHAVGTKSVLAYRGGFAGDLGEPDAGEVADAAARWRAAGGRRLTDRVLLRFGLHRALRLGKPLQLHVGFGDRDCDLHRTNPLLLLDLLRGHARSAHTSPVVLLHCYPFEREAGYLAQAFDEVYLDGGLSVAFLGARSSGFVARLFELAPLGKIVYSSDGFGLPELHHLGAVLWRAATARVLGGFVDDGHWAAHDAHRVATLVGRDTARRLYRLD